MYRNDLNVASDEMLREMHCEDKRKGKFWVRRCDFKCIDMS